MARFVRTDGDNLRDYGMKLMRTLDQAHDTIHRCAPSMTSVSYEMVAMELKDAMDAALAISALLKSKGL